MLVSPRAARRWGEGPESDLVMTVITPAHDNVSIHYPALFSLSDLFNAFYNKPPPQHDYAGFCGARGGASMLIGRLVKCS